MSAAKSKGKQEENSFLNSTLNKLSKPYRVQSAVIFNPKDVTMEDMFVLSNHLDTHWGIEGYDTAKVYQDPIKQIKEREYAKQQKGRLNYIAIIKGIKDKSYVCKRGHYLEDLEKITKITPGPNKYDLIQKWKDPKENSNKPKSAPPKRMTFIDSIYNEQKLRAIPGAGKYNLETPLDEQLKKIEEEKKKKISQGERPTYLNEIQYLADVNPGPGQYNPREVQNKLQKNNTNPKDFIVKHREQNQKRGKSALPDPGSYNPEPAMFTSFGKLFIKKKDSQKDQGETKKNNWGTDQRFKDPKKSKSKLNIITPGPGAYPMIPKWPGKEDGMVKDKQTKAKNWMEGISKGIQKSIYY